MLKGELMPEHLKLRLEPGETEVHAPAADCYLNIREDGTITVKKASGQEVFNCKLWDIEAHKIQKYRSAYQTATRILSILHW